MSIDAHIQIPADLPPKATFVASSQLGWLEFDLGQTRARPRCGIALFNMESESIERGQIAEGRIDGRWI